MLLCPYEVRRIPEMHDAVSAYDALAKTLAGTLPLFMVRNVREQGFDVASERAQQILEPAGFAINYDPEYINLGGSTGNLSFRLHQDGEWNKRGVRAVHEHKTTQGLAIGRFVPLHVHEPPEDLSSYFRPDLGTLDINFFDPVMYEEELAVDDSVVFPVGGENALAHQFMSLPDAASPRSATLTFIDRVRY